jgi:NADPH:quinone reductase-like Zn-dependent oxidoreductase
LTKAINVFEDKAASVDAVIDLVGGDTLARSYAVVKKDGVLATTVQPIDESATKQAGIRVLQVIMKRNAADWRNSQVLSKRVRLNLD